MKTKLFCVSALALCVIVLVACAAPTPTSAPVPPTPTVIPPTPNLAPNVNAILTLTAPTVVSGARGALPQATIRVGDLDRTYLYYVPANLPRNAPLLLAFHGSSMNAALMRTYTGYEFENLADQNGFIVVYPNGYQNSWNDCRKAATLPAKTQNIDDVGLVHALIAKFDGDYGINKSRVFALGWSNGGYLTFRLASELPDEITAIAAVSANLPTDDNNDCRALGKPIPVLIMNGTSDPLNPYNGGEQFVVGVSRGTVRSAQASAEYFAKLNGQTTPKTTRLPHKDPSDPTFVDRTIWNDAGKPEVVLYTINGGGHVVPLGKFSASTVFMGVQLGQATGDLDAPAEIWDFFARQRPLK